mmetsp:Transcript_13277/g.26942  ORF Transcript_13277/g.26942 Transcript_13277/m.26942 type:complete len:132 (+) Transcript_13277:152-547(+)
MGEEIGSRMQKLSGIRFDPAPRTKDLDGETDNPFELVKEVAEPNARAKIAPRNPGLVLQGPSGKCDGLGGGHRLRKKKTKKQASSEDILNCQKELQEIEEEIARHRVLLMLAKKKRKSSSKSKATRASQDT